MDTYRVGTMLEMVRELAYAMADVGLNTRILIQPSMGKGVFKSLPLALSGVMAIMQGMDWEDGLVGSHVNFGQVVHKRFACWLSRQLWSGRSQSTRLAGCGVYGSMSLVALP